MGNKILARLEKLEKAKGVGSSISIIIVKLICPGGGENLTPEEAAALDDYQKKLDAKEGEVVLFLRTRQKAQELLALAGKS